MAPVHKLKNSINKIKAEKDYNTTDNELPATNANLDPSSSSGEVQNQEQIQVPGTSQPGPSEPGTSEPGTSEAPAGPSVEPGPVDGTATSPNDALDDRPPSRKRKRNNLLARLNDFNKPSEKEKKQRKQFDDLKW